MVDSRLAKREGISGGTSEEKGKDRTDEYVCVCVCVCVIQKTLYPENPGPMLPRGFTQCYIQLYDNVSPYLTTAQPNEPTRTKIPCHSR